MPFNVNDFKSNIGGAGGYARANMFMVSFGNPADIADRPTPVTGTSKDLLVKAAQFPGSTVAPMPINYGGRIIKITGFRTFDNWTVTVLNDEDFSHRKWIQQWMYAIAGDPDGERSKIERGTLYNAPVDMEVHAHNNTGLKVSSWNFINAWPTALGDITLDWSSDTIQEYTISMTLK